MLLFPLLLTKPAARFFQSAKPGQQRKIPPAKSAALAAEPAALERELSWLRRQLRERPVLFLVHAEEEEGKTEEPTEVRKRQAREKEGRVYLTQELPQAMLLFFGFGLLFFLGNYYLKAFMEYLSFHLENPNALFLNSNNAPELFIEQLIFLIKLLLPIAPALFLVVCFFTLVQTRFFFSTKQLQFDLKKINPSLKNFLQKTIFSRLQVINSFKVMVKIILSFASLGFFFFYFYKEFAFLIHEDLGAALVKVAQRGLLLMFFLAGLILLLAVPDWFVQRFEFMRQLRMTREEVKREIKEFDGDPQIKEKQRQRARALAKGKMFAEVERADVVITNPYHFACALSYTLGQMDAPRLVAKGADGEALRIRRIAKAHEVPLVENKPLARKIYYNVTVGEVIPVELYEAVLSVLVGLDKFRKKHEQLLKQQR